MSEGVPLDLNNLRSLGVENLYVSAASKSVELQALVTEPSSSLLLLTSRLRTRISHLSGRLAHLTTLGLFLTDITTAHNHELHGHLDRIE